MTPDDLTQFLDRVDQAGREASLAAPDNERAEALRIASAEIDRICRFKGRKADPNQPMNWPRVGATDKSGRPVEGVPEQVERAAYFMAGAHLAGYSIGPHDLEQSKALVAGLLLMLDGLLEEERPTRDIDTSH